MRFEIGGVKYAALGLVFKFHVISSQFRSLSIFWFWHTVKMLPLGFFLWDLCA